MPRVLLVCEYPTINGGEQSLLSVLPLLVKRGFSFAALVPGAGPLAEALAALGIEVISLETRDAEGRRRPQDDMRRQISTTIEGVAPDLVHANSLSMGRLVGPVAAQLQRPSIGHVRDIVGLSAQAVADLNQNTRLLAVSRATQESHVAQGLAAEKTFVVYNGVDLARFYPHEPTGWLHRELGLPRAAQLVGTIGQLVMRKGHDLLVEAAARLADRSPNVHFVLAGERYSDKAEALEHEQSLRHRCSRGPLAGHVHFLGYRANVPEMLAELTLLVHPARQEPLGRVLLEAAAVGIPIVATDVGGTREIFSQDAVELIVPNDATTLAAGIERMLADESRRLRRAVAALADIRKTFTVEHAAEALERHYREVMAK